MENSSFVLEINILLISIFIIFILLVTFFISYQNKPKVITKDTKNLLNLIKNLDQEYFKIMHNKNVVEIAWMFVNNKENHLISINNINSFFSNNLEIYVDSNKFGSLSNYEKKLIKVSVLNRIKEIDDKHKQENAQKASKSIELLAKGINI